MVNTKQSEILLADKTIDGCVIAKVVDKGLTAAQHDLGRSWMVRIGDHHHVVQSSGFRLSFIFYVAFNVGFFIVLGFLFLVYYFDASFLSQRHVLPVRATFFN